MTKKIGQHADGSSLLDSQKDAEGGRSAKDLPFAEFIALMALMMSLAALGTDSVLPAFAVIGQELERNSPQQLQMLVTVFFGGLAVGQLLYGPLSDQIGRKKAILIGLVLCVSGNILSAMAPDFDTLLAGRFLQGFGVAGPRIVMIALIRDLFVGREMARIMSFIMGVFVFVPTVAPLTGQTILLVAGWRAIFLAFTVLATLGGIWFMLRQRETLPDDRRITMTPKSLWQGTKRVFTTPSCFGYMVAAGFIQGPFMLYLSTAQHMFQKSYALGESFPFVFAGLALSVGVAAVSNSHLVMRFGMRFLAKAALLGIVGLSAVALLIFSGYDFVPPLWLLFLFFCPVFFCVGLLFGNVNALAMEEVGSIAGLASAWIGAFSIMIAMVVATLLGQVYDGTILVLGCSFLGCAIATLTVVFITENLREKYAARGAVQ